jgi:hypothetical protein
MNAREEINFREAECLIYVVHGHAEQCVLDLTSIGGERSASSGFFLREEHLLNIG